LPPRGSALSKYPGFGQEETSRVRLPNGCNVANSKNTGTSCFQRLQVYRYPPCLVRQTRLLYHSWRHVRRYAR
jgi:hypothetical protein